jgi:hypothetical protein
MLEQLLMPPGMRISVVVVGLVLLLAAALADAFRLLGAQTASGTRVVLRAVIAIIGALLIAWGTLSHPARPAAAAAAPIAVHVPPQDLVQAATTAIAACPGTVEPTVPDATSASRAQMVAAAQAFKAYDTAVVAYTRCVDDAVDHLTQQYTGVASDTDLTRLKQFGTTVHNTAIDQEQGLADKLNAQVRLYQSKHPN